MARIIPARTPADFGFLAGGMDAKLQNGTLVAKLGIALVLEKIRLGCKAASKSQHQMKRTRPLQIGGLILAVTMMCGCQKQEDKSGQQAAKQLQDVKTAVSITHRKGEAFVVLKSDAVSYMADMQVLCFKPDFSQHFAKWKQDWNTTCQTQLRDFEAKNPELQTKLKSLDDQIAQAVSKTNSVKQAASEAVADLARRLESEKEALVAEQAKTSKAYEEYKQIASPFDQRLKDLQVKAEQIRTDLHTLASETIEKLNRHILDAQLNVSKLKQLTAESLFATRSENNKTRQSASITASAMNTLAGGGGANNPFLIEQRSDGLVSGWYDWIFLVNIPAELEGTQSDSAVKSAYRNWKSLAASLDSTTERIRDETYAKTQALIPWENRHGIQRRQGSALVSEQQEMTTSVQRITERVASLKGGGKEASEMVEAEIQQRLRKITDEVDVLQIQRKQLLEDAAQTASLELKREFRAQFYQLLKQQASSSVQTGSKGDFSVPADIAYLYAERHRENGETLVWLLRVDPKSPDIRMSNSNTTTAGSDYDQFWMLDWKLD